MIGYIAAILVTIAYLPQLWVTIKTKKCGMSPMTLIILLQAMVLWCVHAIKVEDNALLFSSLLSLTQISVLSYYKSKEVE